MSESRLLNELLIRLLKNNKSLSNFPGKSLISDKLLPGKLLILQGKSFILQDK